MSSTGFETFDDTVQKTNELLKDIEMEFGWENRRNQSYAALRAVLHALRDRLPIKEVVQLGAQLPMLVRGMYYEGWRASSIPKKINKDEFLQEVRKQFPFSLEGDLEDVVGVVFHAIRKHVALGEVEDIVSTLPKDIAVMIMQF